ncbi:hypothetical protein ANO11243_078260 [Dothideomycetidae sp. 11243]|nr:hypothetical protein ANO11243_078260 [fungal sp. No.11243]
MDWKRAAAEKRDSVLASFPKEWRIDAPPSAEAQRDVTGPFIQQYLSTKEIEITETEAVGIVDKASRGEWTATEITKAFCHRAALAHQLVNCLHEVFFDDAIESARQLDKYLSTNGKPKGVLHGLPVSLKDQFHIKGVETHMGYVGWIGTFQGQRDTGKEKIFESEMVKELRDLGAVLYCKTSVPHTLMCGETVNNIVGYTFNPTNRHLSTGGSSGGEGALIALRGSPVGFGTDIGGSIRIPAAFNGLYGLRPSTGRLPYEGMANSFDGAPGVLSVVGPLAPNAGALRLVVKGILSREPWYYDPLVHELPYRAELEKATIDLARSGRLCVAVMRHDRVCGVHPPVARALEKVVEVLKGEGHKVIDWEPSVHHERLVENIGKCYNFDGCRDGKKAFDLSGEEISPQVMGPYVDLAPEFNATQIMETMVEKRELCKEYMDYWNSTVKMTGTGRPVDAVLSPVAPFAAARPEKYTYYGYTSWVNTLDYSSAVVPVLKADKALDVVDASYKPVNDDDRKTFEGYSPEIYHGAHVAVQLVGRRLQEEKVLALAEYVGGLLAQR